MLNKEEQQRIIQAIIEAEEKTSGEIRVHISKRCKGDVLDNAVAVFTELKMHTTELRNGTLIYIAPSDKQVAIIGDIGINTLVPADFWDNTLNLMRSYFQSGELVTGVCKGIEQVGILLKEHFPVREANPNELSDGVSFG